MLTVVASLPKYCAALGTPRAVIIAPIRLVLDSRYLCGVFSASGTGWIRFQWKQCRLENCRRRCGAVRPVTSLRAAAASWWGPGSQGCVRVHLLLWKVVLSPCRSEDGTAVCVRACVCLGAWICVISSVFHITQHSSSVSVNNLLLSIVRKSYLVISYYYFNSL